MTEQPANRPASHWLRVGPKLLEACKLLLANAEARYADFDFDAYDKEWSLPVNHPGGVAIRAGRSAMAEAEGPTP